MAAVFTISDDESEEEHQGGPLRDPNMNPPTGPPVGSRTRLNSESHVVSLARDEQLQQAASGDGEDGASGDGSGAPFRTRSQSAPPALWAAMKYGRQLRRMSDEFDSWLDKGEMRRVEKVAAMPHSRSWWSYLFSHKESEVETNSLHPDSHSNRTE